MEKMDIQCLFIGQQSKLYSDLVRSLCQFDINVQVKLVDAEKEHVLFALRKLRGSGLVFISEDIQFSLDELSDLVWQHAPDAVVVVLTIDQDKSSKASKKPINTQFSRLYFKNGSDRTRLFLQSIIQTVKFKTEFRNCKHLLGISEKRCQWLVESSHESIAYITRDLHLYANASYLALFNAESTQKLRSLSIKELIGKDEHTVFKKFLESQLRRYDEKRSIVLSMKKSNGVVFRANIHLIPSVYKGKKCLQLLVNPLEYSDELPKKKFPVSEQENEKKFEQSIDAIFPPLVKKEEDVKTIPNPFSVLKKNTKVERPKVDPSVIILEIIERKEAVISAQRLTLMKKQKKINEHLFLSLVIDKEQKKGVESLLFEPLTATMLEQKSVFWDKVKFTRFFQVLRKKSNLDVFLIIDVDVVSIADRVFTQWLISEVAGLGVRASNLIFLLPSNLNKKQKDQIIVLSKRLRSHRCKIALNDCSTSKTCLNILKSVKPDYIRLSLEWIKQLEGNDKREISLGSAIRQFESKSIKVIAPHGISTPMHKNLALAGASFCQEKAIR